MSQSRWSAPRLRESSRGQSGCRRARLASTSAHPGREASGRKSGSPGRSGLCAYGRMEGGSSRHCGVGVARCCEPPVSEGLAAAAPGRPERPQGELAGRRLPVPLAHMGHHPRLGGRSARIRRSPRSILLILPPSPSLCIGDMEASARHSRNIDHPRGVVEGEGTRPAQSTAVPRRADQAW